VKYHKEEIGQTEYQTFDEDTGDISYEYEPKYEVTHTLETLESLRLEVSDPYDHSWPVETSSFNPRGKRITDRQSTKE